jgi:hypothetical protein
VLGMLISAATGHAQIKVETRILLGICNKFYKLLVLVSSCKFDVDGGLPGVEYTASPRVPLSCVNL